MQFEKHDAYIAAKTDLQGKLPSQPSRSHAVIVWISLIVRRLFLLDESGRAGDQKLYESLVTFSFRFEK